MTKTAKTAPAKQPEAPRRSAAAVRFFASGQQVDEADFWMRVAEATAGVQAGR